MKRSLLAALTIMLPVAASANPPVYATPNGVQAMIGTFQACSVDANGLSVPCANGSSPQSVPASSGGLKLSRVMSAAGTNATLVKNATGQLYGYELCNTSPSTRFVRLFNSATAPTPGTTIPVAGPLAISSGSCQSWSTDIGIAFAAGIAYDITGASPDTDTSAVNAGDIAGFLTYY